MRRLFDALQRSLEDFVEQRDDLMLVAACGDDDVALVLKVLQDMEQANPYDVFLFFSDDFVAPGPYVSVLVERLREYHRIACEGLAQEGKDPLPPLPDHLADETRAPRDRLGDAMVYARSLTPSEGGHRLVWVLFPQHIADRPAYLDLLRAFVPRRGPRPWMAGLRLVCRDLPHPPRAFIDREPVPRVRFQAVDLGQDALAEAMAEDVEDESLPMDARMQSLLSLALLDAAFDRYQPAVEKYRVLLGHYQGTDDQAMQAFVMNGIGEMYRKAGQQEQARHWLECAVGAVAKADAPVVFYAIVRNLGELSHQEGRHGEAEQWFDHAEKLAGHLLDPEGKARSLNARGLAQEAQGAPDRALESYTAAATLARSIHLPGLLTESLDHQVRVLRAVGPADRLAEVERERAGLAKAGEAAPR
jgi:tetratricopeptide (TPR) repeat protein